MENIFISNVDKICDISLKNGLNLNLSLEIFIKENKITYAEKDFNDFISYMKENCCGESDYDFY